jgi:hypothetical protein
MEEVKEKLNAYPNVLVAVARRTTNHGNGILLEYRCFEVFHHGSHTLDSDSLVPWMAEESRVTERGICWIGRGQRDGTDRLRIHDKGKGGDV